MDKQAATPLEESLPTLQMLKGLLTESGLPEFQLSILICRSLSKYSSAAIHRPFILRPRKARVKKPTLNGFIPSYKKA